jgi:hypothetical protein
MRGGRAHYTIEGVPLIGERRTAPRYRFYSVRDEFPGLYPAAEHGERGERGEHGERGGAEHGAAQKQFTSSCFG